MATASEASVLPKAAFNGTGLGGMGAATSKARCRASCHVCAAWWWPCPGAWVFRPSPGLQVLLSNLAGQVKGSAHGGVVRRLSDPPGHTGSVTGDERSQRRRRPNHGVACNSCHRKDFIDVHFNALKLKGLQQCAAPILERLFLALHVRL